VVAQLVEALRYKVPVSTLGVVLGNFLVTFSFRPDSAVLESTQPLTEISLGYKVRPARRVDSCAVLVVPNVKVRTEA
jgi:uncharacterized membrane protein